MIFQFEAQEGRGRAEAEFEAAEGGEAAKSVPAIRATQPRQLVRRRARLPRGQHSTRGGTPRASRSPAYHIGLGQLPGHVRHALTDCFTNIDFSLANFDFGVDLGADPSWSTDPLFTSAAFDFGSDFGIAVA